MTMSRSGESSQFSLHCSYFLALSFLVLFFDHCAHAYGENFGRWHFIFDEKSSSWFFDVIYLYSNHIVTPSIFFCFGFLMMNDLENQYFKDFIMLRVMRFFLPWLMGVIFVVPLLAFPRFLLHNNDVSYIDFLQNIYFPNRMQGGGPFWILLYVMFLSFIFLIINKYTKILGMLNLKKKFTLRSIVGLVFLCAIIIITLNYLSDLYYGSYNWVGLVSFMDSPLYDGFYNWVYHILSLFRVQGSKFLLQGLFFALGIIYFKSALYKRGSFLIYCKSNWHYFMMAAIIMFSLYASYVFYVFTYYDDGFARLYGSEFAFLVKEGYEGPRVLEAFFDHMNFSSIRLLLQSFSLMANFILLLAMCIRFEKYFSSGYFLAYAKISYGLFLVHEIAVTWLQYYLIDVETYGFLKFVCVMFVGGLVSLPLAVLFERSTKKYCNQFLFKH